MNKYVRVTVIVALAAAAAGAGVAYLLKDQIARHRRDLFSPRARKRLAALGYMARECASVDNIRLLRDFIAWEPRPLLRSRARIIVARMEDEAESERLESGRETA
jgi:hypothetical protein